MEVDSRHSPGEAWLSEIGLLVALERLNLGLRSLARPSFGLASLLLGHAINWETYQSSWCCGD